MQRTTTFAYRRIERFKKNVLLRENYIYIIRKNSLENKTFSNNLEAVDRMDTGQ